MCLLALVEQQRYYISFPVHGIVNYYLLIGQTFKSSSSFSFALLFLFINILCTPSLFIILVIIIYQF